MNINNTTNSFSSEEALKTMKTKKGQFFRINYTRKSGNKASFVAKFKKSSSLSVTLFNTQTLKDVTIPFSALKCMSVN